MQLYADSNGILAACRRTWIQYPIERVYQHTISKGRPGVQSKFDLGTI